MNAQQEAAVSVLRDLIQNARNGQEGFRKASEFIVDDPELKMLLASFSLQRAKFAGELEAQAVAMGDQHPDEGSSLAGAAHRWWMGLRASMTKGDNHNILEECERGEDMAKEAYMRATLHERDLPDPVREIIMRQRREVLGAHNTIRALRDATPGAAAEVIAQAREKVQQAGDYASDKWEETKEKTSEITETTGRFFRDNPLALLGTALLAGLTIGLIFHGIELRNERNRMIRSPRVNRLIGRVREGAEFGMEKVQHGVDHILPRLTLRERIKATVRQLVK
jgi:uncharacterized protein (TIGR02284 family)